eukprot:CAMPEP_0173423930 /NCGR_PEP_ID=MMETSP1357-20121228/4022_1 /TAXON_ID=77926 /ORGANISM="Hemiselmis rufescens, Strain PCC563" /LENGTH=395 /DNA_ID=CAMNT_0014387093 /DNA_START=111 /DNA_END=1299 /DNA_ORIENTATION=-
MAMSLALLKGAVDVVINTKKAVDFLKNMSQAEEDGFYLWRMLDALSPAMSIALSLRRRHVTLRHVESAVEVCRYTWARCEEILERDGGEDDDRPDDADSWSRWFDVKKKGVTRRQAVKDMLGHISMCQNTLQLSLTTVVLAVQNHHVRPRAAFRYIPAAQEMAVSIIQEFEFGRIGSSGMSVAVGEVQRLENSSTRAKQQDGGHRYWKPRGSRDVRLMLSKEGEFSLEFRKMKTVVLAGDSDSEDEEGGDLWTQAVTSTMPLRRLWMDQVPNLEVDEEDEDRVAYIMGDCMLGFDSVGRISAEVFEAIICMLKRMAPSGGKARACLADAVDVAEEGGQVWRKAVEKELGEFEAPAADETARGQGGLIARCEQTLRAWGSSAAGVHAQCVRLLCRI